MTLHRFAQRLPLAFALHPRILKNVEIRGVSEFVASLGFLVLPPQGCPEMQGLVSDVKPGLTDSLRIHDETKVLVTPCFPMRGSTQRTSNIDQDANTTVGRDADAVPSAEETMFSGTRKGGGISEYWDGRVVERIDSNLSAWLADCVLDRTVVEVA